jgi:hypothetical protein
MRSRTLLVAGIGAALITLAGCGGTSINGSATPQGGGGAPAAAPKIASVADLGALVQHNASGKNSAHIQLDMTIPGAGAITAAGDMKFAGAQSAEQMTMTLPGVGDMQMVMLGRTIYMKIPSSLAGLAGGAPTSAKPWMKIDLNGSSALSKSLGSTANLAGQTDPTQLINQIAQAGTITSVNAETLDGVATKHYTITVDVRKMLATMGTNMDPAQQQAMSSLGVTSMPFDIWVNSDNLPVKITTKIAVSGITASGGASEVDMTVIYSNWGESVNIQAPPADQVGGN